MNTYHVSFFDQDGRKITLPLSTEGQVYPESVSVIVCNEYGIGPDMIDEVDSVVMAADDADSPHFRGRVLDQTVQAISRLVRDGEVRVDFEERIAQAWIDEAERVGIERSEIEWAINKAGAATPGRDGLSEIMEFGAVVRVGPGGSVWKVSAFHAPEVYQDFSDDGFSYQGEPYVEGDADWKPLTGYSGQHGYSGPMMHSSEYIGGGMAQAILDAPGVYVATVPSPGNAPEVDEEGFDVEVDSWVVLFAEEVL